ncbi:hypothetical protein Bca4012_021031 [Brassica carinata]
MKFFTSNSLSKAGMVRLEASAVSSKLPKSRDSKPLLILSSSHHSCPEDHHAF